MTPALLTTCALSVASAAADPAAAAEVPAGDHPLVRGALVGDHALVYGLTDHIQVFGLTGATVQQCQEWQPRLGITRTDTGGYGAALRAGLAGGPPDLIAFDWCGLHDWPTRYGPVPLRWKVAGGGLYLVYTRTDPSEYNGPLPPGRPLSPPLGGLVHVPLTAPVLDACRYVRGAEGVDRWNVRSAALTAAGFKRGLTGFNPVNRRYGWYTDDGTEPARRPEPELWRTHFDFHPAGPGRFELYVSAPGGLERHHVATEQEPARWALASAHPPAWVGPFYVVADGADRHFVTADGVFTLPADAKPGAALVKTWDGGAILALVDDSDAGKSYAFTRTHCFHVTSKPDPKLHGLPALPGATGEEALDTVAACGRVVRGFK